MHICMYISGFPSFLIPVTKWSRRQNKRGYLIRTEVDNGLEVSMTGNHQRNTGPTRPTDSTVQSSSDGLNRCRTSYQRVAGSISGRALWSVPGQDSLFHIALVYPAAKWEVLRACALYAASCSGISPGGLKWFPCVQAC